MKRRKAGGKESVSPLRTRHSPVIASNTCDEMLAGSLSVRSSRRCTVEHPFVVFVILLYPISGMWSARRGNESRKKKGNKNMRNFIKSDLQLLDVVF